MKLTPRRRTLGALAIVLVLATAWWGWQAWRTYDDLRYAQTSLRENASLLDGQILDLSPEGLVSLEADFQETQDRIRSARQRLRRDPIYAIGGVLPWVGTQKDHTETLLSVAEDLTRAGVAGSAALQEVPSGGTNEDGTGEQILAITREHAGDIQAVLDAADQALAAGERLRGASLVGPLAEVRDELLTYEPQLNQIRAMAAFGLLAPDALGGTAPRSYLVLGMNSGELMPGGGFIGNYAIFRMNRGSVEDVRSNDVYALYDEWKKRPDYRYVAPPEPLRVYLLGDTYSWAMGEAAWYPDFPSTATTAERFLALGSGEEVDGAVGLTIPAMEALLRVTGPIELPAYGIQITAETIALQISFQLDEDEGIFGAFLDSMTQQLLHLDRSRWYDLWQTMQNLTVSRDVFIHFDEARLNESIRDLGWDGAIPPPTGDTFLIAGASVRSTKLNFALTQAMIIEVDLSTGQAAHMVTMQYHNAYDQWKAGKDQSLAVEVPKPTGVLGNYVQLYAPPISALLSILRREPDGRTSPVLPEHPEEALGYRVSGTFLPLAIGEEKAVTFSYTSPSAMRQEGERLVYELMVQKQAGVPAYPVTFRITPLEGARIVATATCSGRDACQEREAGEGAFDLKADTTIRLEMTR